MPKSRTVRLTSIRRAWRATADQISTAALTLSGNFATPSESVGSFNENGLCPHDNNLQQFFFPWPCRLSAGRSFLGRLSYCVYVSATLYAGKRSGLLTKGRATKLGVICCDHYQNVGAAFFSIYREGSTNLAAPNKQKANAARRTEDS